MRASRAFACATLKRRGSNGPVEQLAPGTRHPAGERTLQMRVAWRAATIFRRAGAPASDAARIPDARGWLHFCLDPDRMGFVRKGMSSRATDATMHF